MALKAIKKCGRVMPDLRLVTAASGPILTLGSRLGGHSCER
ncbi:hypothetical protein V1291_002068 [Nitrobacteraceae bacterium AZCC 1564]